MRRTITARGNNDAAYAWMAAALVSVYILAYLISRELKRRAQR
jgi:hypothetical protein